MVFKRKAGSQEMIKNPGFGCKKPPFARIFFNKAQSKLLRAGNYFFLNVIISFFGMYPLQCQTRYIESEFCEYSQGIKLWLWFADQIGSCYNILIQTWDFLGVWWGNWGFYKNLKTLILPLNFYSWLCQTNIINI